MVSLEFFSVIILPVALWPWGRISLWQKWVPSGVFPGGKGGLYVRLTTLPPSCAVVMKYGNLNFLESSGPLQACNGTALRYTNYNYLLILYSLRPTCWCGAWGSVVVRAPRYYSDGPGIDSRWCQWGYFPWYPRQNHVPWGRLGLWKWVPGISPGVKAAGAFGWRPTTLVVSKRQENPGP